MAFLPVLSAVAGIGGTIMGAVGQGQQSAATAAQANYQAQVARNNQLIEQQNAAYATQAARVNAQGQDFQTARALGTATAGQAAGGVDVTTGSPVAYRGTIAQAGRLRSLQDIQEGARAAYGYQTQATGYGAEAGLQRYKAASAQAAAPLAIGGTILGGAASLAPKWAQYQQLSGDGANSFTGTVRNPLASGGDVSFNF